MKKLMESWRHFLKEEEEKAKKEKEEFEPHMMYDPETGEGKKAEKYEDHVKMDEKGWTHEKPDLEEAKNKDGKEQGVDGKACWKGYKHAGSEDTDGDGSDDTDRCVPMEEETKDKYDDEVEVKNKKSREQGMKALLQKEAALEEKTDKDRMDCNKPRYIKEGEPGYGKKQKVVKACKDGEEKIVRFGDANMENKSDSTENKSNFRSRHNCDDKKDKFSAGYWSCKDW